MFVDNVKIYVKAGDGGSGAVSFRREKYVPAGGPDGGDGGRGGNIIFEIEKGSNTLLAFRYKRRFIAGNGEAGKPSKCHGKSADDLVIKVPEGTLIKDAESGKIIKDMSDSEPFLICRGGRGGWGNRRFATATRQVPRFAKGGRKGEERELILELKMLADVGLIGFPNVGKSSILARISAAKPKIADYHFTTLSPNLGVVAGREESAFVAADIPGLIEGAAQGVGLGHEFLRHIERCRLLLHVVDISAFEGREPIEDIKSINIELSEYSDTLAKLPQIIVANKSDMLASSDVDIAEFERFVKENEWELIYVSAVSGSGLDTLVSLVFDKLLLLPPPIIYEPEIVLEDTVLKTDRKTDIRQEDGVFVIEGEWLYNLMGQINFDDHESLAFFQRVLQKGGVIDLLSESGAKDGDIVSIYDFEFEYIR